MGNEKNMGKVVYQECLYKEMTGDDILPQELKEKCGFNCSEETCKYCVELKQIQNNMAEGLMQVYLQPPRPTPRDYEFLDGLNRITGDKNITSVFLLGIIQMWSNEEKGAKTAKESIVNENIRTSTKRNEMW